MFDDLFSAIGDALSSFGGGALAAGESLFAPGETAASVGDALATSAQGIDAAAPGFDLSMTDLGGIGGGFSGTVDPSLAGAGIGAVDAGFTAAQAPLNVASVDPGLLAASAPITAPAPAASISPSVIQNAAPAIAPSVSAPISSGASAATGGGGGLSAAGGAAAVNPANNSLNSVLNTTDTIGNTPSTANDIGNFLKSNAGWLAPVGLGSASLLKQVLFPQQVPGIKSLTSNATGQTQAGQAAIAQAQPMIAAQSTGQIPAGAEAGIEQAYQQQVAAIKGNYASRGMSGSTSEMQDLAAAAQQKAASINNVATQITQTGLQELGIGIGAVGGANSALGAVAQAQLQQDEALQQALAEFALAAGIGASTSNKSL